jgi:serine/threonine-protein kinase
VLERELGRGGMAIVFLARDLRHRRPVALKVLDAELAPAVGAERFQREIQVAAGLQHPHILTVLDSGETAGRLWFTMPFVEGESLRERLRREGLLPVDEALRLAREVADGLQYAHQRGVIHRDIKPENILLSAGHALIADFGLARAVGASTEGSDGAAGDQLTRTGLVMGTPAYMSPEQASGERALGPGTDVYSLAAVLYEMLAGTTPFTGPTAQAVMAKHFSGEIPSLRQARPAVPEGVEAAVRKELAPEPNDRFASAAEFAKALDRDRLSVETLVTAGTTRVQPSAPHVAQTGVRSPRRTLLATLGVLALLGAGLGLWWTQRTGATGGKAVSRLAVLPFENVGETEDEYFADGLADAVRGKLSAVPGLQVIASSSSDQYKRSGKTPQQIGRELGAQYLLVGKVRWQKTAGGVSRVQVSPELIDAASATTRWQQPFDTPLADVFAVQGDIASRVAQALDVALGAGARQRLTERPTQNLAAYDAFLRGERLSSRVEVVDLGALRKAVVAYEEAVALDSSFALAWAQLSRARSTVYINSGRPQPEGELARVAAERALVLGPGVPQVHFAQALYLSGVRHEHARALEEVTRARRLAPANAELLSMAGLAEQQLGRWDDAVKHFREAQSLDPRSLGVARRLARVLLWLRRYPEARAASDYALRLSSASPDVLDIKIATYLGEGDLAGAQAVLRDAPPGLERSRLLAHVSSFFGLFWILDDEQQRALLQLGPDAFDDDRGAWAVTLAQTHALRGNNAGARAYADSARIVYEQVIAANPEIGGTRAYLGLALAMLGRRAEAVKQGELAMKLEPIATNGFTGPFALNVLALIYVILRDEEAALDRLEQVLQVPYYLSPGWLRIDPEFAALRDNPRFQRMTAGR